MIAKMDNMIARIELPETQAANENILEEDEEVLEPSQDENDEEFDDEVIANFDEKKDFKLAQALEEALALGALPTSPPFKSAFHVQLPVKSTDQSQDRELPCTACSQEVDEDRFEDFNHLKILTTFHRAFAAGREFK
jgi:hypothetical protein